MKSEIFEEMGISITVCKKDGEIIEMNKKAVSTFAKSPEDNFIGRKVQDCHPEPARTKLQHLLDTASTNAYTIEKNGVKKLIYQTPWYKDGEFMGLVELSMEIPMEMPHYVRTPKKS